ncbi:hypothetical protein H6P81_005517 [Aristolochia fimbriata]|uniref:Uncharacterized protein n=1 Tax=Aristolochia fimbriata TaxID=158543 RepID=A0AAV7EZ68_ARIFI|nr:hypothetical protein H6P81_005517 [Aristolochia fimbriata]
MLKTCSAQGATARAARRQRLRKKNKGKARFDFFHSPVSTSETEAKGWLSGAALKPRTRVLLKPLPNSKSDQQNRGQEPPSQQTKVVNDRVCPKRIWVGSIKFGARSKPKEERSSSHLGFTSRGFISRTKIKMLQIPVKSGEIFVIFRVFVIAVTDIGRKNSGFGSTMLHRPLRQSRIKQRLKTLNLKPLQTPNSMVTGETRSWFGFWSVYREGRRSHIVVDMKETRGGRMDWINYWDVIEIIMDGEGTSDQALIPIFNGILGIKQERSRASSASCFAQRWTYGSKSSHALRKESRNELTGLCQCPHERVQEQLKAISHATRGESQAEDQLADTGTDYCLQCQDRINIEGGKERKTENKDSFSIPLSFYF